jgi:hexosaminidase
VTRENCDLLREATKRYYRVILQTLDTGVSKRRSRPTEDKRWKKDPSFRAYLGSLEIQLMAPCEELPYLNMDEHCEYDFMAWIEGS